MNTQLFKTGNLKIGNDTIIFNMGPAATCPSAARNLCAHAKECYALKAERIYKNVTPYRERQREYWLNTPPAQIYFDLLQQYGNKLRAGKINYFRFNESGDFHGPECIRKAAQIAKGLYESYGVLTYTYTARRDLFEEIRTAIDQNRPYFTVNGSNFSGLSNRFEVIRDRQLFKTIPAANRCPGNCRFCYKCKTTHGRRLFVLMH